MEAGYWKPVTGLSLGLGKILTLRLSPEDFPFCANKKTPIFFFIKHCNQGEARGGAFNTSAWQFNIPLFPYIYKLYINISIKVEIQEIIFTFSSFKYHHNNPPPLKCWNAVIMKE